ncbi:hypothetical protein [Thalassospira xiamenensis]|uniref:hypothetical protein n=1 Tax=Thalassospira xiamenensis TaxID=220697 RepID=UPI003AA82CD8
MSMIGRIAMAVFALGAFAVLSPAPAYAACSDADPNLCSEQQCNTLQSQVHSTCDQPRTCNGITDQTELKRRLAVNQACLKARQNVQACFSSTDSGHQTPITDAQTTIANCQSKITG